MPTATARFNSTTGDGATWASASYSATICGQSVSSGRAARAWQAARAARSEERREGQSVSVRVDLGGRRIINKKNSTRTTPLHISPQQTLHHIQLPDTPIS